MKYYLEKATEKKQAMNPFKRILKFLLARPVTWMANRFSSDPKQENVNASLSKLYKQSVDLPGQKSGSMFTVDVTKQPIIIFSDQHKGARDGSDDFAFAEANYLAALDYYNAKDFYFVNLGDCEELWENTIFKIIKQNKKVFEKEKLFINRNAYCKIIGNHDLFWKNDLLVAPNLIKKIYGQQEDTETSFEEEPRMNVIPNQNNDSQEEFDDAREHPSKRLHVRTNSRFR